MIAVGVDSCRFGWIAVAIDDSGAIAAHLWRDIGAVCAAHSDASLILVDIPIGLPRDSARACDKEARRLLAPRRSSSVFPVPCRPAVYAPDYRTACEINRGLTGKGLTKQTWNICPKIREVDEYLHARRSSVPTLRESHPELCFWALAGGSAMRHPKRTREGYAERLALISRRLPLASTLIDDLLSRHGRARLARDDVLDALVLAISATTPTPGLRSVPRAAPLDAEGLVQEIVFPPIGGSDVPQNQEDAARMGRTSEDDRFADVLKRLYARFVDAYQRGDAAALVSLYSEDAALIEPDKEPIRGRDTIETNLRDWFERFRFSNGRWEVWEHEVAGDTAWDLSYFEMDVTRLGTEESYQERWKQLCLWKRQVDGAWRLYRLIFNSHRIGSRHNSG